MTGYVNQNRDDEINTWPMIDKHLFDAKDAGDLKAVTNALVSALMLVRYSLQSHADTLDIILAMVPEERYLEARDVVFAARAAEQRLTAYRKRGASL